MKQYVKDNAGNLIEVSDLQVAIRQVAAYLSYLYEKVKVKGTTSDLLEQRYWKDLYTKLCLLREKIN